MILHLEEITNVEIKGNDVVVEITLFSAILHKPISKRVLSISKIELGILLDCVKGLRIKDPNLLYR